MEQDTIRIAVSRAVERPRMAFPRQPAPDRVHSSHPLI